MLTYCISYIVYLTIGEYFAQIFGFWSIIDQKYFFFLNRDFESFWPFWSNFFWFSSMPKNKMKEIQNLKLFFIKKGQNDSKFLLRKKKYFWLIMGGKIYFTPQNRPKIPLWLKSYIISKLWKLWKSVKPFLNEKK